MANKKMLIDATHPEETRVVVISGNRLDDFDVEVESRKQLKGNIYLAKVTRVEPSLQAAFVDYGGNRHGFLSFNEIHPDYFQIPVADREELEEDNDVVSDAENAASDDEKPASDETVEIGGVEIVGGDDSEEVEARRPKSVHRLYKIQEVIKRRQILLVQVVKEERGNKGAALTTFISLAGRYCVLMPNTARGGGISRKISPGSDRKKLRAILSDLDIPEGMAVIVRTAGSKRSKSEIKRDYEYLLRLWDRVREVTLESSAPTLVHEEGDLIKRSIRDIYNNDIEKIIIAGEEGYRTAKDFMKLLIPSHAKRVQPYRNNSVPLIRSFNIEDQLNAIHSPNVQLKSGGYVVINPTEALVAIDVNSGRSTRERNIEETALRTNLEAADEIARQVRLRDLAGLIVIDFIDMEIARNNSQVERRLKDAMRNDRARIQLGKISPFGLLEMSRQRLRPSLIETSSEPCPHCEGTGILRSTESSALFALRSIEEESARHRSGNIVVHMPNEVALYILNFKRDTLAEIESRHNLTVLLAGDDSLIPPNRRIERVKDKNGKTPIPAEEAPKEEEGAKAVSEAAEEEEGGKRRRRPRRRRRKSGGEDRTAAQETPENSREVAEAVVAEEDKPVEEAGPAEEGEAAGEGGNEGGKRRRRGRRGGRRRSRKGPDQSVEIASETQPDEALLREGAVGSPIPEGPPQVALVTPPPAPSEVHSEETLTGDTAGEGAETVVIVGPDAEAELVTVEEPAAVKKKPARRRRAKPAGNRSRTGKAAEGDVSTEPEAESVAIPPEGEAPSEKPKPRRRRKPAKAKPAEVKGETISDTGADTGADTGEGDPKPATIDVGNPASVAVKEDAPKPPKPPKPIDAGRDEAAPKQGDVINIDSPDTQAEEKSPRKGWWNR